MIYPDTYKMFWHPWEVLTSLTSLDTHEKSWHPWEVLTPLILPDTPDKSWNSDSDDMYWQAWQVLSPITRRDTHDMSWRTWPVASPDTPDKSWHSRHVLTGDKSWHPWEVLTSMRSPETWHQWDVLTPLTSPWHPWQVLTRLRYPDTHDMSRHPWQVLTSSDTHDMSWQVLTPLTSPYTPDRENKARINFSCVCYQLCHLWCRLDNNSYLLFFYSTHYNNSSIRSRNTQTGKKTPTIISESLIFRQSWSKFIGTSVYQRTWSLQFTRLSKKSSSPVQCWLEENKSKLGWVEMIINIVKGRGMVNFDFLEGNLISGLILSWLSQSLCPGL